MTWERKEMRNSDQLSTKWKPKLKMSNRKYEVVYSLRLKPFGVGVKRELYSVKETPGPGFYAAEAAMKQDSNPSGVFKSKIGRF